MKRRSGWIAAALLGTGLLFVAGQSVWAESHESAASENETVEPLEEAAGDAGDQTKRKVKAGKKQRKADRDAAARERKKARAEKKAAKREARGRAKKGGEEARKGRKARERRSERAGERANSQWQEDATRGEERAGAVRDAGDEPAEDDLGELDAEAGGAAGETPEQGSSARRGKGEPPEQAKGFWGRFFGSGGDDEE